jgi:arylsulfatase A-like enzyme
MQTDWVLGRIMDALDKAGVSDNTLLVFTSDNGFAPYVGVRQAGGGMERYKEIEKLGHYPSADRRGYKSDLWDGGHRVPFIVRWPAQVKPGTTSHQLVSLTDLMATCADLLGEPLPETAGEDSVSILPALLGTAQQPLREAVVYHSIHGSFAIRQGRWKLGLCPDSGGWSFPRRFTPESQALPATQLYDMQKDAGERQNESASHPEVVEQLSALLKKYVDQGRSTPGAPQKNDVQIEVIKTAKEKTAPE